jgi:hypothetical protein
MGGCFRSLVADDRQLHFSISQTNFSDLLFLTHNESCCGRTGEWLRKKEKEKQSEREVAHVLSTIAAGRQNTGRQAM